MNSSIKITATLECENRSKSNTVTYTGCTLLDDSIYYITSVTETAWTLASTLQDAKAMIVHNPGEYGVRMEWDTNENTDAGVYVPPGGLFVFTHDEIAFKTSGGLAFAGETGVSASDRGYLRIIFIG